MNTRDTRSLTLETVTFDGAAGEFALPEISGYGTRVGVQIYCHQTYSTIQIGDHLFVADQLREVLEQHDDFVNKLKGNAG